MAIGCTHPTGRASFDFGQASVSIQNSKGQPARAAVRVASILVLLSLLLACSPRGTSAQLVYQLEERAYRADLNSQLILVMNPKGVSFQVDFVGGGGSYDQATLQLDNSAIHVVLADTDGRLQNMKVTYRLSGEVTGLAPGTYTLSVESGQNVVIASDTFELRSP
jgi:hypothetical protein